MIKAAVNASYGACPYDWGSFVGWMSSIVSSIVNFIVNFNVHIRMSSFGDHSVNLANSESFTA